MQASLQKIVVIGGNGFIGSAVCKAALARGLQVTSVSSSGRPYQTTKGHTPSWAAKVNWQAGDALQPQTFAHLLAGADGVVHTLGTLLEDGQYKMAVQEGNLPALLGSFYRGLAGQNPLEQGARKGSYEVLNRDAALRVCNAFLSSADAEGPAPRTFVYISAEDIFRPLISARYIETKREAERGIEEMVQARPGYKAVYIRPSLVYHAHHRPLTSPVAALLDLSASLHAHVPPGIPTPSSVLRSLGSAFSSSASTPAMTSSPLESMANALVLPPIHVDHVAEAVCVALDPARDVHGIVGVQRMRELIGWDGKGQTTAAGMST